MPTFWNTVSVPFSQADRCTPICLWGWKKQVCNIQNRAKVWNYEFEFLNRFS